MQRVKNAVHLYRHFIMELVFRADDNLSIKNHTNLSVEEVTQDNLALCSGSFNLKYTYKRKYAKNCHRLLLRDGKQVLGYACLSLKGGRDRMYKVKECDAYIYDVFVFPEHRGKRYVSFLLNALIEESLGCEGTVRLCVRINNVSAQKAYQHMGFQIIAKKSFLRILRINIPQQVI